MNGGAVSCNGGDGAVAGELTPDALIGVTTQTQPDAENKVVLTEVLDENGELTTRLPIITKVEAADPDCENDGNIEYWYNENDDTYYLDEAPSAAQVRNIKSLDKDAFRRADADYSETITVTDVSMIAGHVKNIKPIVQKDKNAQ